MPDNSIQYDAEMHPMTQDVQIIEMESVPTLEEVIVLIRKLAAKRDGIDQTIMGLKKQAENMVKKL